jgi:hypothetical protein
MGTVKTVQVVDSKGNKLVVNEEDAGKYKKASPSRAVPKPPRR